MGGDPAGAALGHHEAREGREEIEAEVAMELGFALGLSMSGIPELDALLPLIATEDVIGIGARDRQDIEAVGARSVAGLLGTQPDGGKSMWSSGTRKETSC